MSSTPWTPLGPDRVLSLAKSALDPGWSDVHDSLLAGAANISIHVDHAGTSTATARCPVAMDVWSGPSDAWAPGGRAGIGVVNGVLTQLWVGRPVAFSAPTAIPGVTAELFWEVVTATDPQAGPPARCSLHRSFVGAVSIGTADKWVAVLRILGDELHLDLLLNGDLRPEEAGALGLQPKAEAAPTLADIAALLGTGHAPHGDLGDLPAVFRLPASLSLDELGLALTPGVAPGIVGARAVFGLGEGQRWPLVPGFDLLSVGELKAALEVLAPLDPAQRRPKVELSGVVAIDTGTTKARLAVSARWPDLFLEGELVDGRAHPIVLPDLVSALHMPTLGASGPALTALAVQARPTGKDKRFTIRATAEDVLTTRIGDVSSLDLALDVARGATSSLSATLTGHLQINLPQPAGPARTVDLQASLACVHDAPGWKLSAGLEPGAALTLPEVIGFLDTAFVPLSTPKPLSAALGADALTAFQIDYDTHSHDTSVALGMAFAIGNATGQIDLQIDIRHQGGQPERSFAGSLSLVDPHSSDRYRFQLQLDHAGGGGAPATDLLLGSFKPTAPVTVDALLRGLGVADVSIPIQLDDALLARVHDDPGGAGPATSATLLMVDMGGGINLAGLPLVGSVFGPHASLDVAFRVLGASAGWDKAQVDALNAALPAGFAPLPNSATGLAAGASLVVTLTMDDAHYPLDLGLGLDPAASVPPAGPAPAHPTLPLDGSAATPDVHWIQLQKAVGPVHFQRVGARYAPATATEPAALEVLLDASLSVAGLTLGLDGLGVRSPLDHLDPSFELRGLSLDLQRGPLEIGGAFLRGPKDSFAGEAILSTAGLTLSALGIYQRVDGHPSMFIYAVLDYPLGGPSFFFVTGLAAGFGYNRRLVLPALADMARFPLVAQAMRGAASAGKPDSHDLDATLSALQADIPPDIGETFFAVGVRFSSFELIDSFALLSVSFGSRFEIDVLGLSTLVTPPPEDGQAVAPIAEVQLAIEARFVPAEGFLGVQAQLTPASFILSRDCHLTGGFAMSSWFLGEHAGDFVVTMGGYHPSFKAPSHYPVVPRLAFQWDVSSELVVKGDAYYALTNRAIMAGGHLEATYTSGAVAAWFKAGLDVLMQWKPYHYEATLYIDLGASITFHFFGTHHIQVELGANLQIWGPDFGGKARIHLWVVSFTLRFGSDKPTPPPVPWATFQSSFLPAEPMTVACVSGLRSQGKTASGEPVWLVDPEHLLIELSSQVPAHTVLLDHHGPAPVFTSTADTGIAPMGVPGPASVPNSTLASTITVTLTRDGIAEDPAALFELLPVYKNVPSALWGQPGGSGLEADGRVVNALVGVRLHPPPRPQPKESRPIDRNLLSWRDLPFPKAAASPAPDFTPDLALVGVPEGGRDAMALSLGDPAVALRRAKTLRALGIKPERATLHANYAASLRSSPEVGRHGPAVTVPR